MASPEYEQLLVVQGLDTKLDQLRHRHAQHPIRAELEELAATRVEQQVIVDGHAEAKHELDRQQKRLDDEVSTIEEKRKEIDDKLYDGSVTATKDLLALQEEARMLLERQTSIEDDELEIMEQLEPIEAELETAAGAVSATDEAISAKEGDLTIALAEVEVEQESVGAERSEAIAKVPDALRAAYEQSRADLGGIAVAELTGSTCSGCNLKLSAVDFDQIKKKADDAVVNCPECNRLLIR